VACRTCGSDWTTIAGKDCNRCPACDRLQRCIARKQGRLPAQIRKSCGICGASFDVKPTRQHAKTCESPVCRSEWIRRRRAKYKKQCGLKPKVVRAKMKAKKTCCRDGCNRKVKDNKFRYCGKKCAGADAREHKRDFMGVSAEMRSAISFANWMCQWAAACPVWMRCECCGKQIERLSSVQRVCSEKCRYRLENPLHQHCCDCGSVLNAETRYIKRCDSCKRKRRNHWKKVAGKTPRKRCRRHGVPCDATIKSVDVFNRDGYKCQLCGRKCLSKFKVINDMPHPSSPTVDHIIAISLGIKGHTWDNVQCCCWECNVAKGAQAKGQLRFADC